MDKVQIYYEGAPVVQVRFGAITNFESVEAFFQKMAEEDEDEGLARIDALRYDQRKESTAGKLFFYLVLDREGEIKVNCGKLDVTDITPSPRI